jgi:hypothetical protein
MDNGKDNVRTLSAIAPDQDVSTEKRESFSTLAQNGVEKCGHKPLQRSCQKNARVFLHCLQQNGFSSGLQKKVTIPARSLSDGSLAAHGGAYAIQVHNQRPGSDVLLFFPTIQLDGAPHRIFTRC